MNGPSAFSWLDIFFHEALREDGKREFFDHALELLRRIKLDIHTRTVVFGNVAAMERREAIIAQFLCKWETIGPPAPNDRTQFYVELTTLEYVLSAYCNMRFFFRANDYKNEVWKPFE